MAGTLVTGSGPAVSLGPKMRPGLRFSGAEPEADTAPAPRESRAEKWRRRVLERKAPAEHPPPVQKRIAKVPCLHGKSGLKHREKFTENQIPTDLGAKNSGPKAEQNVEVRIYQKSCDTFRCSSETIDDKQPPRQ